MFGNVNVDYTPCKSVVQLDRASRYILGELPEQQQAGIIKTAPNLCWDMNCDREIFSCDILTTRKLFGKRDNKRTNLAFKMSLSFSPEDNDKLTYEEVFRIAKEFAEKFFTGYQVMFAVHTDTPHKHVHFLIGNCHIETGKAFRRSQKDLYNMCEFFGEQCQQRSLVNSIRENFYNHDIDSSQDREKVGEYRMKAKGKETFKDELREVIQIECTDPNNHTLEDVVNALMEHYHVECRVKGNTISYRHPNYTDKNGKLASVRGSKLGDKYTVKGIEYELGKIWRETDRADPSVLTGEKRTASGNCQPQTGENFTGIRTGENASGTAGFAGSTGGNDECCQYENGNCGRGSAEQGNDNSPRKCGKIVRDTAELYAEYAEKVRQNERQSIENSQPARTVRKKRKGIDH